MSNRGTVEPYLSDLTFQRHGPARDTTMCNSTRAGFDIQTLYHDVGIAELDFPGGVGNCSSAGGATGSSNVNAYTSVRMLVMKGLDYNRKKFYTSDGGV